MEGLGVIAKGYEISLGGSENVLKLIGKWLHNSVIY